jgi:Zn-dependent M28 family amino/carboxypeptidase
MLRNGVPVPGILRKIMKKIFYAVIMSSLLFSVKCSEHTYSSQAGIETPESIMNYVDGTRYADDLAHIAVDRTLGSPGHDMVRDFCARRLTELGFKVKLDLYGTGVNVIGRIDGTGNSNEAVIISAHYDSRNAGCPGADDNASGVAGALEAARVLAKARYSRTLIIALWDEEEKGLIKPRGLHGSRAYAAKARSEGKEIVLSMVFEMIGYCSSVPGSQRFPAMMKRIFPDEIKKIAANKNRGDFICLTVNEEAKSYSDIYAGFANKLALPSITLKMNNRIINIHDFRRSDHAAFWENGYSALLISDTTNYRNNNYHCKNGRIDDISRLDTAFTRDTIKAAVATAAQILGIKF